MDIAAAERYILLALSVAGALVIDYLVVRALMELLRPASAYSFLAGRVGKLASLFAWLYFFNTIWAPRYLVAPGRPVPPMVATAVWAVGAVVLFLACTTIPRSPLKKRTLDG